MIEATPDISVVVPVHDEEGAAGPLAREIAAAFAGRSYEMVFVDDGDVGGRFDHEPPLAGFGAPGEGWLTARERAC